MNSRLPHGEQPLIRDASATRRSCLVVALVIVLASGAAWGRAGGGGHFGGGTGQLGGSGHFAGRSGGDRSSRGFHGGHGFDHFHHGPVVIEPFLYAPYDPYYGFDPYPYPYDAYCDAYSSYYRPWECD